MASSFTKHTQPQEQCVLFKLPPEIRDIVYELVYAAETNQDGTIDLKTMKPPTKDLATTCQRLYAETYALFKAALPNYWRHEFVVHQYGSDVMPVYKELMKVTPSYSLKRADFAHTTRLRFDIHTTIFVQSRFCDVHPVIRIQRSGSRWYTRVVPMSNAERDCYEAMQSLMIMRCCDYWHTPISQQLEKCREFDRIMLSRILYVSIEVVESFAGNPYN